VNLAVLYVYDVSTGVPNVVAYEVIIIIAVGVIIGYSIKTQRKSALKWIIRLMASFAIVWGGLALGSVLDIVLSIAALGMFTARLVGSMVLFVVVAALILWLLDFANDVLTKLKVSPGKEKKGAKGSAYFRLKESESIAISRQFLSHGGALLCKIGPSEEEATKEKVA
jgi:large-conductance mechanosensitive channel